jgi:hypothetical protein
MKKYFLILSYCLCIGKCIGQYKVGENRSNINASSMLEIEATNKGLLLSRVALTALAAPNPLANHVAGMVVFNTTNNTELSPGIYVNSGSAWIKTGLEISGGSPGSWYDVASSAAAASNSANIYQMGRVSIGTKSILSRLNIGNARYETKISLFDAENPTIYFGFGVSPGALNYHTQTASAHVFSFGGKNGELVNNETLGVNDKGIKLSKVSLSPLGQYFLVLDSVDKVMKTVKANQILPGLPTASNGISKPSTAFQLGGTLDENTTLDLNAKKLNFTNVGNIGINTSSPTAILDVNGNTRFRALSFGSSNDHLLTMDGNGNLNKIPSDNIIVTGLSINQTFSTPNDQSSTGNVTEGTGIFSTYDGDFAYNIALPPANMNNVNTRKTFRRFSGWTPTVMKTNTNLLTNTAVPSGGAMMFISDGSIWKRIDN